MRFARAARREKSRRSLRRNHVSVRYLKDYDVEVVFANGEKHRVPLRDEIVSRDSQLIRPLKNKSFFAKVFVNPEGGNLEWPNGYDICPDILYWLATGKPITFSTDPKYHRPPAHLQKPPQRRRRDPKRKRAAQALKR